MDQLAADECQGEVIPYESPNGGGYTLEAELGILPNGNSDPDYMGWEVKQYSVKQLSKPGSAVITLMTPEPTGGQYRDEGVGVFLQKYGYPDKRGRENRINFGGIHRHGEVHRTTSLEMRLIGFDVPTGKILDPYGMVALFNRDGEVAASWSFASLLGHWAKKHNRACYVPSVCSKSGGTKYRYGSQLILGTGADFELFLQLMAKGRIYYDPAIKQEGDGVRSKTKRRSQFRIQSKWLKHLYQNYEIAEL
ncbi:MvaI/BcnI family restriction endonuclease [Puia sp. P3]|uniref:MvaI/BcnI family restriction endonuclease n=1 Tax=Puia sp. P3 TaxID=3423952 RepID=UPI003D6692D2